jgi:hypothetical protein
MSLYQDKKMFSKSSRYRKMQQVLAIDAKGRTMVSLESRLLPEVTGKFHHTIEGADRLDNLSFKYYKQSKKFWRLCDANPDFLSPLALLGKEPIVTTRFPLTISDYDGELRWADLLKSLTGRLGVLDINVMEDVRLIPESVFMLTEDSLTRLRDEEIPEVILTELEPKINQQIIGKGKFLDILRTILGEEQTNKYKSMILKEAVVTEQDNIDHNMTVYVEYFERSVIVTHNRMIISAKELGDVITAMGFETNQPVNIGRIGKYLVVPSDSIE